MVSKEIKDSFHKVGAAIPHIMLPADGIDLNRFAVIACDQHSADLEYWQKVEEIVGTAPSALKMMLPEAWLKTAKEADNDIYKKMSCYCDAGVLSDVGECLVYVRRHTSGGVRRGIVIALDLEEYNFSKDAKSMIRATEETVIERLPARVEIRNKAPLEMPHILVLIDDTSDALMGAMESSYPDMEMLYDFDLMLDGGHITGYRIDDEVLLALIADELAYRLSKSTDGLLYAMGDGNHSFAAAKMCWDEIKKTVPESEWREHPARYCMCEIVNIYDPALEFEPIHRALFGVDPEAVQREVGFDAENPPPLQKLQPMLDEWLAKHPEAELEYIHGEDECRRLCAAPDRLAIILPEFEKRTLFEIVRKEGVFVRKSFSMGHAKDKRYYLECRKIK